jgi:hypothetical protein
MEIYVEPAYRPIPPKIRRYCGPVIHARASKKWRSPKLELSRLHHRHRWIYACRVPAPLRNSPSSTRECTRRVDLRLSVNSRAVCPRQWPLPGRCDSRCADDLKRGNHSVRQGDFNLPNGRRLARPASGSARRLHRSQERLQSLAFGLCGELWVFAFAVTWRYVEDQEAIFIRRTFAAASSRVH